MAVTYNFTYPATGATPPAAAAVQNQNEVICEVTTDGTLTTATVTHNLGIPGADLTLGFPDVAIEPLSDPNTVGFFVASKTANTVVLTNKAAAGSANIKIKRPTTLER